MALEPFTFEKLPTLDEGRLRAAFDQCLRRVETDCRDRPLLKRARTVTLEARLAPVADDDGNLLEVTVSFDVRERVPVKTTKTYHLSAARQGLLVNELSPDDSRQLTLDMPGGPRPIDKPDGDPITQDAEEAEAT